MVRKVFVVVHHRILTRTTRQTKVSLSAKRHFLSVKCVKKEMGHSLLCVLVLDSEPLVEFLLSDSLLGQPPEKTGDARTLETRSGPF